MTSMEYRNFVMEHNRDTFQEICSRLASQTKELLDLIKKRDLHGKSISKDRIKDECGDLMFYLISFLIDEGLSIEGITDFNAAKIKARSPLIFRKNNRSQ
jgi:NTP pyrophosphatase (non-canonical NTP hydrolase)